MKVPNESDPTLFMKFYATEKIQGLIQVVRENSQGQIEEVLSVSAFEGLHQAFDEIALFYLINGFKPTNAQLDEAEKLLQVVVDPKMAALMV